MRATPSPEIGLGVAGVERSEPPAISGTTPSRDMSVNEASAGGSLRSTPATLTLRLPQNVSQLAKEWLVMSDSPMMVASRTWYGSRGLCLMGMAGLSMLGCETRSPLAGDTSQEAWRQRQSEASRIADPASGEQPWQSTAQGAADPWTPEFNQRSSHATVADNRVDQFAARTDDQVRTSDFLAAGGTKGVRPVSAEVPISSDATSSAETNDGIPGSGRREPSGRLLGEVRSFEEWDIYETAMDSLSRIGAPAVPALVDRLRHPVATQRAQAALILARIGPEAAAAVPALQQALQDLDPDVRKAAARALGQIGPEAAASVESLLQLIEESQAEHLMDTPADDGDANDNPPSDSDGTWYR